MTGRSNTNSILKKVDTCRDATELLLDFVNGELDSETGHEFEKHLEVCPDCVAFLNTYKKTIELTKTFFHKK